MARQAVFRPSCGHDTAAGPAIQGNEIRLSLSNPARPQICQCRRRTRRTHRRRGLGEYFFQRSEVFDEAFAAGGGERDGGARPFAARSSLRWAMIFSSSSALRCRLRLPSVKSQAVFSSLKDRPSTAPPKAEMIASRLGSCSTAESAVNGLSDMAKDSMRGKGNHSISSTRGGAGSRRRCAARETSSRRNAAPVRPKIPR